MKKIFVINGGQKFAHSGGTFNKTITEWTAGFFTDAELRITDINERWDADAEAEKFVWADVIIYHTPVWWFQLPFRFKQYLDEVFTAGHQKGIYRSDGRSRSNPDMHYGRGGMMQGRKYMLTTSWNAPAAAFTLPGEFFMETSVDDGVMFGFHRMNAFTGMEKLPGFHFHDMEKNATPERVEAYRKAYLAHLASVFAPVEA